MRCSLSFPTLYFRPSFNFRWATAPVLAFLIQHASPLPQAACASEIETDEHVEAAVASSDDDESWYPLTEADSIWNSSRSPVDRPASRTRLVSAEEYADLDESESDSATQVSYFEDVCESVCETVCAPACCPEFWEHRSGVWGEYMFLRPRGADVVYATPVDGTLATSVPVANQELAGLDYSSGFRVGAAWAIDCSSSFTASYMWMQAASREGVELPGVGTFLRADTVHPNTVNVAADSLTANTNYLINLHTADLNYKAILTHSDTSVLNYLVGVKYARLDQEFEAIYSITGTTKVDSDVLFDGTGPRFGLEHERLLGCHGFMVFTRANVNFLAGSMIADYNQTNVFAGTQADTGLTETRIVTVPELELGAGWQSSCGRFRLTAGYYMAAWFNMMTTTEYLSTVRTTPNTFEPETKTLTLDGLTARAEYRF